MRRLLLALSLTLAVPAAGPLVQAEIAPEELVAPQLEISGGKLHFTIQRSAPDRTYQLQYSETMAAGDWQDLGVVQVGNGADLVMVSPSEAGVARRFYRLLLSVVTPAPEGFALIPAGSFQMGDQSDPRVGASNELPVHRVYVGAFYMGKYEVIKEEWDAVRTWALTNGYPDLPVGNGTYASKGANHPVHSISWYDVMKWCNARSEKEGLTPCYTMSGAVYKTGERVPVCGWSASGYRLPTEAEWEKTARGGWSGKNFPWGDTINHSHANYRANGSAYSYDTSDYTTYTYHPTYKTGSYPYSSTVGSFPPNGYGVYDMSGNMWEWCWDWYGMYAAGSATDPRGPAAGSSRVMRGGSWNYHAAYCRAGYRFDGSPGVTGPVFGFRLARSSE